MNTHLLKSTGHLVSFIAFTILAIPAFGQETEEFITPVTVERSNNSPAIDNFEQKIRANRAVSQMQYIKMGNLAKIQKGGTLRFSIPGRTTKIVAKATHVEYISDKEYKWYGQTDDGRGNVIILCMDSKITAHISLPDGVYEIYSTPNKLHVLQTMNLEEIKDIHCASTGKDQDFSPQQIPAENDAKGARLAPCPTSRPTRVLVLVSPAAVATGNNINQTANLAVSQFNSCIYNSGITSGAVLELAGVQNFNFVESTVGANLARTDVNRLAADFNAQNLRNQFQADLVVLLTNGNYAGFRGIVAAIGPNSDLAYAIVQINDATNSKSFAHEIGHLYGGRHQDDNATPGPQYAKGYLIKNWLGTVVDCTIMATASNGGSRLLNFSNPSVSVSGRATGTTGDNNNARRVGETFSTLKTFRIDPTYALSGYIEGPDEVASPGLRTFEAVYSCGSAPYTFAWATSLDGIIYTSNSTTTETFNYPFYPNSGFTLHVRSTVNSSNGQTSVSFKTTRVNVGSSARRGTKNMEEMNQITLDIYPNPSMGNTLIEYYLPQEAEVSLEMLDYTGRSIQKLVTGKRQAGLNVAAWDATSTPAGLYVCRIKSGNSSCTKRVVVTK